MKKLLFLLGTLALFVQCNNISTEKQQQKEEEQTTPKKDIKSTSDWRLDSLNARLLQDPSNPERIADRAAYLIKKGSKQSARADIYKALSVDSTNARVHEVYGLLYMEENNSRNAKNEWVKCANLDPKNMACRLYLAELYIAVKNYDQALVYVNEAIEIDKYESQPYLIKGIILRDTKKDTAGALKYFQQAVDLDQNNVQALDMMGVMLAAKKDTLAPYYYKRAIDLEPNNSELYYKLGVYYMNNDQVNRALENYTKAVQLNPQDADSYYNMGYIHIELKMNREAIGYFSKAIQTSENNYKAHYGRGYAYEVLGDVINAEKDYKMALSYLPIYQPAKTALNRIQR